MTHAPPSHSVITQLKGLLLQVALPLLAACAAIYAAGYVTFDTLAEVSHEARQELQPVHRLQLQLRDAEGALRLYVRQRQAPELARYRRLQQAIRTGFEPLLLRRFAEPEERRAIRRSRAAWIAANALASQLIDHGLPREQERAMHAQLDQASRLLGTVYSAAFAEVDRALQRAETGRNHGAMLAAALALVGLGLGLRALSTLRRHIVQPLLALEYASRRLAAGHLDHRLAPGQDDEFGHLARTFNTMAEHLQQHQEQLRSLATLDGLTQLPNHTEFQRRLTAELAGARRHRRQVALLFLDLDHFKQINDRYGHPVGDRVLQQVADLLRHEIRPGDLAARYGGEEFTVVLPETDLSAALEVAERLRRKIATVEVRAGSVPVPISVSIGVAVCPQHAESPPELLAVADSALYAAKHEGRNRVAVGQASAA